MTRDEAIMKLNTAPTTSRGFADAEGMVQALTALGIIKLDEQPPAFTTNRQQCDRIDTAIAKAGWKGMDPPVLKFCGLNIQQAVHMAGLKIVEA